MWVACTHVPEKMSDIKVVLYGTSGISVAQRVQNLKNQPFLLTIGDIGRITKISFLLSNLSMNRGLKLHKLRMKDMDTKEELGFHPLNRWLFEENGEEAVTEFAAVRPDEMPLKGIWDVTIVPRCISVNLTLTLTVCDDKGSSASVLISKGSFKSAEAYHASLQLDKKFSKIYKIRLEVEDTDGETWCCREVKLQNRTSKEILEFPCLQDFSEGEGCTVAEFPILTTGSHFLSVKPYILYISTDSSPKSGTDSDVYVTLKGSLGDTGRRKLPRNGEDSFAKGKVDVFQVKAVDLGTLHELLVEKGKGSDWHLEKIIVKEPKFPRKETLFIAQTWLKDKTNRKQYTSVALNVTEIQERKIEVDSLLQRQQMKSEGSWKIYFTKCNEDSAKESEKSWENISKLIMVFYGKNGKSEPISLKSKVADQAEDNITFDVHFPSDLGMLYKVNLGVHHLGESIFQLFHHCKMQNTVTLDTFSLSINKTLPLLNGDRWIEFPVEWPLREALSVVTYDVKVFCNEPLNNINLVHLSLCVYGTNGDTEDRALFLSLPSTTQQDAVSFTGHIDAVDLGVLHKVTLLIGSKSSCRVGIKTLHLNEASKQGPVYIFEVNEIFLLNPSEPEIRRELSLINKEDDGPENLTEYKIKVYTGDKRGAGTDANVHIILFGDKDTSQLIQLKTSLDHRDPFERGRTDTFEVRTKNIGRLQKIEIGHDGKGFGSGWFLEKVEITDVFAKEQYCFSCNRWLAKDENDGRTVVQFFL